MQFTEAEGVLTGMGSGRRRRAARFEELRGKRAGLSRLALCSPRPLGRVLSVETSLCERDDAVDEDEQVGGVQCRSECASFIGFVQRS